MFQGRFGRISWLLFQHLHINLNRRGVLEYLRSNYVQQLEDSLRRVVYLSGARLDELIKYSTPSYNYPNVEPKHKFDASEGWEHRKVIFESPIKDGDKKVWRRFEVQLICRKNPDGKFSHVIIGLKNKGPASYGASLKDPSIISAEPFIDYITQIGNVVKNSIRENTGENTSEEANKEKETDDEKIGSSFSFLDKDGSEAKVEGRESEEDIRVRGEILDYAKKPARVGLTRNEASESLSKKERRLLARVANIFGVEITLVDSLPFKKEVTNGFYENRHILIAKNAKNPLFTVLLLCFFLSPFDIRASMLYRSSPVSPMRICAFTTFLYTRPTCALYILSRICHAVCTDVRIFFLFKLLFFALRLRNSFSHLRLKHNPLFLLPVRKRGRCLTCVEEPL